MAVFSSWYYFIFKVIIIQTLTLITYLSKELMIQFAKVLAKIICVPDGARQYVVLAVGRPSFWIDTLIGFGPNDVRQYTRARRKSLPFIVLAMIGYVIITAASSYLAAMYLDKQELVAYRMNTAISPFSYRVVKWGESRRDSASMIIGPTLMKPGLQSKIRTVPVAILSNSRVVNLLVTITTSEANGGAIEAGMSYQLQVDEVIIGERVNSACDKFFGSLFKAGNIVINEPEIYKYVEAGITAPQLESWKDGFDLQTRDIIHECLKQTIIFGYDPDSPYVRYPLYILLGLLSLAILTVIVLRAPSERGFWSRHIGRLGALINSEPLNDGLIVKLWRSEAARKNDSITPLYDRDTSAKLRLRKGRYSMFPENENILEESQESVLLRGVMGA
ncbi:hypothetical protein BGZ76_007775 [Entomortierella beljakovae]|nr:hypothetical protein BGZ76_007775 [Entomortierella beljakovae]